MWEFIIWFRDRFYDVTRFMDRIKFNLGGYEVSFLGIMIAFIILGMVIAIFWKGGRE